MRNLWALLAALLFSVACAGGKPETATGDSATETVMLRVEGMT